MEQHKLCTLEQLTILSSELHLAVHGDAIT